MTAFDKMLDGKVALITGGARGQGAAEARLFVEHGARVFIADVLDDLGKELAESIGDRATYLHLDVSDEVAWSQAMAAIDEACGGLDVLINNAGVIRYHTLEETTLETYMMIININQVGTFLGMRSAVPLMRKRGGGSIINISSSDGLTGANSLVAYCASKWAVRGMTRAVARELGQAGIRVNSVHPGGIKTPIVEGQLDNVDHDTAKIVPLYRFGEAEEVARTVLFLASDLSGYTSGAEVSVDGGMANTFLYEGLPGAPAHLK